MIPVYKLNFLKVGLLLAVVGDRVSRIKGALLSPSKGPAGAKSTSEKRAPQTNARETFFSLFFVVDAT
jgi:hypothetical protein